MIFVLFVRPGEIDNTSRLLEQHIRIRMQKLSSIIRVIVELLVSCSVYLLVQPRVLQDVALAANNMRLNLKFIRVRSTLRLQASSMHLIIVSTLIIENDSLESLRITRSQTRIDFV